MGGGNPVPRDEATLELVRQAIEETRTLVRLEVALARHDAAHDLQAARVGATTLWLGISGGIIAITLLLVAVASAFATFWLAALLLGTFLLLASAPIVWLGWSALSKRPLAITAEHVKQVKGEIQRLRERVS
ncbi:MAG: phage holin family protein [Polyangiaceae bacterium]